MCVTWDCETKQANTLHKAKQILTSRLEIDFDTICTNLLQTMQILFVLGVKKPSLL